MRISDWSSDVCSSDLLRGADARTDPIADVRPVEPREHQPLGRHAELDEDILARVPVRRRGQREPRHPRKGAEQRPQQHTVGAAVMPPFRNSMRLAYCEHPTAARPPTRPQPLAHHPTLPDPETDKLAQ